MAPIGMIGHQHQHALNDMKIKYSLFFLLIPALYIVLVSNVFAGQNKIPINSISVNNFMETAKKTANNDYLLAKTDAYMTLYQTQFKTFLITVYKTPFQDHRQEAENQLLDILGVTKQEACWLKITIGAYKTLKESALGLQEPSFCSQHQSRRIRDKATDVNRDGTTNTIDLVRVLLSYGKTDVDIPEDINGDMVVNPLDLSLVFKNLGVATSPQL